MRVLAGIFLGIFLAVLGLEIALRVLPVNSGLRLENTSEFDPINRYLPEQPFVYSHGWAMINARTGFTSKQGFINSANFDARPTEVLVVGDSFIESQMLGYVDTVQGRLASALGGGVYALAASGNGLADALVIVKKYVPALRPRSVVIFVKTSDPHSIDAPALRGHNGFVMRGAEVGISHAPYQEAPVKRWALQSALLRYLFYNLKVVDWWAQALASNSRSAALGQAADSPDEARRKIVSMEYFLSQLAAVGRTNGTEIRLLLDADRGALYRGRAPETPSLEHERLARFIDLAKAHGLAVTDMQPVFARHWADHKARLDFLPADGHWNGVAHKLAAETLLPAIGPLVSVADREQSRTQ